MGVNCCDICPEKMMGWCHEIGGAIEGYWDIIRGLNVDGLAPCDHSYPSQWYDAVRIWREDMHRYFVRNRVVQE